MEKENHIADFFGQVKLFNRVAKEVLEQMAAEARLVRLPHDHMIRDTSADSCSVDGLYVVKSGAAKVTRPSENRESEAVLAIPRPGSCFGEIGLIDGLPPSANVTAMGPMECYFLPRDAFQAALKQYPEIALGMLPSLSSMVRSADDWIAQLL